MRNFVRKHTVVSFVIGVALALAAGAAASWIVFDSIFHASGGATVATAVHMDAVTFTPDSSPQLSPGTSVNITGTFSSASGVAETLGTVTVGTITSSPPCSMGSSITFTPNPSLNGQVVPATGSVSLSLGQLSATNGLSSTCSGASLTIPVTGSTSP
jgi:hypothetical protein